MALYKYVIAERIDVLKNELIRFSQPSVLNDPWDTRPHVERIITDGDLEYIAKPITQKSDAELLDYMAEIIEKGARERNLGDKSREEIKQALTEANREFPGELRKFYESVVADTLESAKAELPHVVDYIPEAIDRALGVLSLTEKPDHPLMWSHYSGNHSGFVLMFDETHHFFSSGRKQPDNISAPQRIQYRRERPAFDALIEMSRLVEEPDDSEYFNSWIEKLFFTKSQVWEYEQEWRMIKSLQDAVKVIEAPSGNIYLFSLPPDCIEGIVLGHSMRAEIRAPIVEFMKVDQRYRNAQIFEARSSRKDFKIEIVPI